jgi:copper(I)-binding protein
MMPGGMGAVYLLIQNPGGEADRLLAVSTPAAAVAEIHESLEEDGMMRMVAHPDGFEVPAGSSVELAPGGKHIMLLKASAEGSMTLTLHFEKAGEVTVEAKVGKNF